MLIHAPLYYHLAALLAWTMARTGLEPMTAALVAGRSLSLMGLAMTLTAVYRLARLDGAPARAGWLAVCLFACRVGRRRHAILGSARHAGGCPPDRRASSWCSRSCAPSGRAAPRCMRPLRLFGLAICVKQHFLVGPLVSTCLLLVAGRRGQRLAVAVLLTGLTIVVVVYGTEELATGGRMSQSVFVAAANAARVHPPTLPTP